MTWENMSELREELDKNGIAWSGDYDDNGDTTAWKSPRGQFFNCGHERFNHDLYLHVSPVTANQAITATLDDDDYELKMDALLCRLTNGKFSKSRAYDLDFMESCVNEEFEQLYEEELADTMLRHGNLTVEQVREAIEHHGTASLGCRWQFTDRNLQAIADELNASLGSGTCENIAPDYLDFLCSKCGFVHYHSDENDTGDGNDWNFCPKCGDAVK